MKQFLLKGPGFSGRGVRIQILSSSQVDTIREQSAKGLPLSDDEMPAEARQQLWVTGQKRAGIAAMVVEVSAKDGFKTMADLTAEGVAWQKPSVDELADQPDKYFSTKDLDALGDMYFRFHVANKKELDDILGEALDVTAG